MTPLFNWKPEYSVNDADLDSHHILLFDMLNKLYDNLMISREVGCVLPIIEELSQFTRYHFSEEERHMRIHQMDGIESHIAQHREFTQSIETLKADNQADDREVTQELIILLGNWLLNHVLTEDRKYSANSPDIKE